MLRLGASLAGRKWTRDIGSWLGRCDLVLSFSGSSLEFPRHFEAPVGLFCGGWGALWVWEDPVVNITGNFGTLYRLRKHKRSRDRDSDSIRSVFLVRCGH
jgi:hypothetical protein